MVFDEVITRIPAGSKPKSVCVNVNGRGCESQAWKLDEANGYVIVKQPVTLSKAGDKINQIEL